MIRDIIVAQPCARAAALYILLAASGALASLLLLATPTAAQTDLHGDHGHETPPVTEVWDEFVMACEAMLADPQSFVETHPTVSPDGEQIVHSTPDNQAIVLARVTPSGVVHQMELIGVPGELHILCQVQSEPDVETLMDIALYDRLSEQSAEELRALIAERGGSAIAGGRMPLEGVASAFGMADGIPGEFYSYVFGIQTTLGGAQRFVYATVNGGGLALVGHYILRAEDMQRSAAETTQPKPEQPQPYTSPEGPEVAMRAAVEQCLRNYRTPQSAIPAFQALGLTLTPGMDQGSWEFVGHGIFGIVSARSEIFCSIQSQGVNLDAAREIGTEITGALFPDTVQQGAPEGGTGPCDGLSIFAPQQLIWLRYSQAGNSGECINDGTSAIIIN